MSRTTSIPCSIGLLASLLVGGCQGGGTGGGAGMTNIFQTGGRGETWTIQCKRIPDDVPNRKESIEQLASALGRAAGIDPSKIQVAHDEDASTIYYGTYRAGRRDGQPTLDQSARDQVAAIRSLAVGDVHLFLAARLVPTPTPDVGPAEWNVKRCGGSYSLEVGEFYNENRFTERKEAAVVFCRELREKGYEAYYWHGPQRSNVYVGALEPERDFMITPQGIYLGPKLKQLIDGDPELLKFKYVNGGYSSQIVRGQKVWLRAMPMEVPGRRSTSDAAPSPRTRYRPMRP